MATAGSFKAGGFAFPTSTGSLEVDTGLGEPIQGIIFFGGNQADEDTLVHPTAPGVFFGMAWHDVDTGLVDFQSQSNTTLGVRWKQVPIHCLSSGVTIEYEASAVTFDATGKFTLTISDAAPALRRVHYLAWSGFGGTAGKSVGNSSSGQVFTFGPLGYRPLSALGFGMFASGSTRAGSANGAAMFTMATADFPTVDTDTNNNNASALMLRARLSLSDGLTFQEMAQLDTGFTFTVSGGILGFWQDQVDHLNPTPDWDSDTLRLQLFGFGNRHSLVWWDCEGSTHHANTPAVAATDTITAPDYIDQVQAALFFGTTGYSSLEQAHGTVHAAYVYGVLTDDYQGVVAFDTGQGDAPADGTKSFYQSQAACFANSLSPGGGIRVASGEIIGDHVVLTGEIASNSEIGASYVHFWGPQERILWIPQDYRISIIQARDKLLDPR